ncbi:hypothetical protein ACHWQZ_G012029 [Mnemiopsis leidyi]
MKVREDYIFRGEVIHFSEKAGGFHVDWFDYNDLKYQYFLSHAHKDHYSFDDNPNKFSLMSAEFISELKKNKRVKIYCTSVTRDIILRRHNNEALNFEELRNHVEVLEAGEKKTINLIGKNGKESGELIRVTAIPANHIPGAVMFLFEDLDKRALYTGDFRYDVDEKNEEMGQLKDFFEKYDKVIDYLYVDLTFLDFGGLFHPNQNKFPSRPKVVQKVIDLINAERPSSIHIDVMPMGTESIIRPVAEYFNISANSIATESENMKEFTKYLLKDIKNPSSANSISIHTFNGSIRNKGDCSKCKKDTLRIRPTTQWIFHSEDYNYNNSDSWSKHFVSDRKDRDFWQFLYSHHSSDYGLRKFLSCLQFIKIFPITGEPFFHEASNEIVIKQLYDFENSKDLHRHIKKSLYFTIESDRFICSYKKLNVLWFNGDYQRDDFPSSCDKFQITVGNFRSYHDIVSLISNQEDSIDIITIPCTDQLKKSIGKLYCNLFRFIDELKDTINKQACTEDNIILFYSSTANENEKWKQIIDSSRLFRDRKIPLVYYVDLTKIEEERRGSRRQENEIVVDTLKNLIRNKGKEVFVSDWPLPYKYSARKREYDKECSQQPESQKRALEEVEGDADEGELSQTKRSKTNSIP